VEKLLASVLEVELFLNSLERKGIPFRDFLQARDEIGRFPRYQLNSGAQSKFVYSEDEFAQIRKEEEEFQRKIHIQTLASIPLDEQTEELRVFVYKPLHFIEVFEEKKLHTLRAKLADFGFSFDNYLIADGKLYDILDEESKEFPIYTLKEGIDFFRTNGRKGIEIQRYKGLGEMNADQLWETTMDPMKRTLIRVALPDAIAADHMFTMLMGEDVPPRRAFIEQHALSVKNLDI